MRPHISVSVASHKVLSRSPSPIVSQAEAKVLKGTPPVQVPMYLQSSPFRSPNSFLATPNKTNSAAKQLHMLPESLGASDHGEPNKGFIVPNHVHERMASLEVENNQLKNEVSLLTGMNQTKENYIKELEAKISALYSESRKDEMSSYSLKKKEENFVILLREQKRLFDGRERVLQKEIDELRALGEREKTFNFNEILDKSDNGNSRDLTREFSKNMEIEKTYMESTLKVYKINISELEAKVQVLNNENNKLNKLLAEKSSSTYSLANELSARLRQDFENQRTEIEGKLQAILAENKKLVTFNSSLLAELDRFKGLNESLQKKHEAHIEELKSSWKLQAERKAEDLKNLAASERKALESQLALRNEYCEDIERRLNESLTDNKRIRGLLLEKEQVLSQNTEKLSYYEKKLGCAADLEQVLSEKSSQLDELKESLSVLLMENRKLKEVVENNAKEIDLWRDKYTSTNEIHLKVVEDFKFQLENRRSALLEAEVRQRTGLLEGELASLRTRVLILEAEKKGLEERLGASQEEVKRLEGVIGERMSEILRMKEGDGKVEDLERENNEKAEKIGKLEDQISQVLGENSKLNQAMKLSINERELLIVKFEAFKQEHLRQVDELRLQTAQQVRSETDSLRQRLSQCEAQTEALTQELAKKEVLVLQLGNSIASYSSGLAVKEQEMLVLAQNLNEERARNEQNRLEVERFAIEKEQLLQKLRKIEENHEVELSELRSTIKTAQLNIEEKRRMEVEFSQETSVLKDSLRVARERLVECHRVLRALNKRGNSQENLQRNLEEAERSVYYLCELLGDKGELINNPNEYSRISNYLSHKTVDPMKAAEVADKLMDMEREHENCYRDLRAEIEKQVLANERLRAEFEDYRAHCCAEHLGVIERLGKELEGNRVETEKMRKEYAGEVEALKREAAYQREGLEIAGKEIQFTWEKEYESRVLRETFQLRTENNELKRSIFGLENENRQLRRDLQFLDVENVHLKKNIGVLTQKHHSNSENIRTILGTLENKQLGNREFLRENGVLKARINELENLNNRSFEGVRRASLDKNPRMMTNKPPLGLLDENERINAQILKRCREILN